MPIKSQFPPIRNEETIGSTGINFHKSKVSVKEYTFDFIKQVIMLVVFPMNPDILLKYLGGIHSHLKRKAMFLKPRTVDEVYVQAQYLENMKRKKRKLGSSKKKQHLDTSRYGKNNGKEKYMKTTTMAHQCKDIKIHCNH